MRILTYLLADCNGGPRPWEAILSKFNQDLLAHSWRTSHAECRKDRSPEVSRPLKNKNNLLKDRTIPFGVSDIRARGKRATGSVGRSTGSNGRVASSSRLVGSQRPGTPVDPTHAVVDLGCETGANSSMQK